MVIDGTVVGACMECGRELHEGEYVDIPFNAVGSQPLAGFYCKDKSKCERITYVYYVSYVRQFPGTSLPIRFNSTIISQNRPITENADIGRLHEILNEDHRLEGSLSTVLSFQLLRTQEA